MTIAMGNNKTKDVWWNCREIRQALGEIRTLRFEGGKQAMHVGNYISHKEVSDMENTTL